MNDLQKTLTFVGAAVVAVLLAWEPWVRPVTPTEGEKGTKLFAAFENPLAAKSLDIVEYDESTASIKPFSIAQVNGLWSIPSHQNYPADARDHLAQAATSVMDLEILSVVSKEPGSHAEFGVIDPDIKSLKPGMTGVGTRVTLKDEKGDNLADLIVGKEVKDHPNLRYVRKAGNDYVYEVAIKTDKLSTKFDDWIEKDLLKFSAFDLSQLQLNDYSIEEQLTQEGGLSLGSVQRSQAKLAYDDAKTNWNLLELNKFEKGKPVPVEMTADEELNTEKLNALKTALTDLKIVDVERKPKGLSTDLRASDEFVKDREAIGSLASRGFYPVRLPDGAADVLSSEGEVIARMKDGVEYVLRFGQLAGGTAAGKGEEKDPAKSQLNRYLFVMAQFNEGLIPKPELAEVPGGEQPTETKPEENKDAAGEKKEGAAAPVEEQKDAAPESESEKIGKQQAADAAKAATDKPATDKPATDTPATDKPATSTPATDKPATDTPADPLAQEAAAKAEADKRAAVIKNNKRLQDEYEAKVKKGQEHAKELNDRFADWYYVISDETYHKIHLSRADIIKKKEVKAGEGDGVGDLKALEKQLKDGGLPPGGAQPDEASDDQ